MSEKDLLTIQQKATTQFTRMIGFECTFPKAVVHAPISFGGLGFHNLYAESNIMKIEAILCHINKMTPLGETMKTILNWVQIHSGREIPILQNGENINYVQDNWYKEIKKFLNRCNATLIIKSAWRPRKLRENDVIIMDHYEINNIAQSQQCGRDYKLLWRLHFKRIYQ
jgi:hypothetical protein